VLYAVNDGLVWLMQIEEWSTTEEGTMI